MTSPVVALTNLPLPPVPDDLLQELLSYMMDDQVPLSQKIMIRTSNFDIKEHNKKWSAWVRENITPSFIRCGIQRTNMGDLVPHRDQGRRFGLLYLAKAGGDQVFTKFYKSKPGLEQQHSYDYDQVILKQQFQFKEKSWNLINNRAIHSVNGITNDRISLSIDFLTPEVPKFIADLELSAV